MGRMPTKEPASGLGGKGHPTDVMKAPQGRAKLPYQFAPNRSRNSSSSCVAFEPTKPTLKEMVTSSPHGHHKPKASSPP